MFRHLVLLLSCTAFIQAVPFDLTTPPLFGIPRCVVSGVYYWDPNNSTCYTVTSMNQLAVLNPALLTFPLYCSRAGGDPRCGGGDNDKEYEKYEQAIFHALESAEERIVHAVRDEVNIMFPRPRHEVETAAVNKPKQQQQQQAPSVVPQTHRHHLDLSQVRLCGDDKHRPYPYDLKGALDKEKEEHNIAHAAEAVEKAVVHAIEQEVETIFPHSTTKPVAVAKEDNDKKKPSSQKSKATRPSRKTTKSDKAKHDEEHHNWHPPLEEFLEFTDE